MKDGFLKIACATPDVHVADCAYNREQIVRMMQEAAHAGAALTVFPELCITGYTCLDLFLQDTLLDGAEAGLACILREIFGEEDSYRIGGDEFVAFALDSTGTELNENMEQFVRQVEEAGYSVAVGTASHSAGGIDIDALVKKAEQRMYLDKSRHYEQLRRGTEE